MSRAGMDRYHGLPATDVGHLVNFCSRLIRHSRVRQDRCRPPEQTLIIARYAVHPI